MSGDNNSVTMTIFQWQYDNDSNNSITFGPIIQCTGFRARSGHGEGRFAGGRGPVVGAAHPDVVALPIVRASEPTSRERGWA